MIGIAQFVASSPFHCFNCPINLPLAHGKEPESEWCKALFYPGEENLLLQFLQYRKSLPKALLDNN